MENVRENDISPSARKRALEAAADGNINFREFQEWLINATKVDPNTKNTFASEHYHASIGSAPKPVVRRFLLSSCMFACYVHMISSVYSLICISSLQTCLYRMQTILGISTPCPKTYDVCSMLLGGRL